MAELNSSPEKTGGKNRRKKLSTRVDLTAMVDLAFLLITFFMLTTSLSKPHILGLAMPDKPTEKGIEISDKRTLTICIGKNNQLVSYLGMADKPLTEPVIMGLDKQGIRKTLIETSNLVKRTTGKPMMVLIKPSGHSVYSNLVDVLDELTIAGVDIYAVEDITPKDIGILKIKNAY